jgi:cell division protein FtsB
VLDQRNAQCDKMCIEEKLAHAQALLSDAKGGLRVTSEHRDGHTASLLEKDRQIAHLQHQMAMLQTEIHSLRDGDGQAAHIRRMRVGFQYDDNDTTYDGDEHHEGGGHGGGGGNVSFHDGTTGGGMGGGSPSNRSQSGRMGTRSPRSALMRSPSRSPRPTSGGGSSGGENNINNEDKSNDGKRTLRPLTSKDNIAGGGAGSTGGDAPGHVRTASDPPPLRRMQSLPLPLKHRNFIHESVSIESLTRPGSGLGSSAKRAPPTPSAVPAPQPLDVSARSMSAVAEESGHNTRASSRDTSRVHSIRGDDGDDDMVRIGVDEDHMQRAPSRGGRPGSSHGSVMGDAAAAGGAGGSRLEEIKRRFAADQQDSTLTSTSNNDSVSGSEANSPNRPAGQPTTPRFGADGQPITGYGIGGSGGGGGGSSGGASGSASGARPYSAERFESALPAPLPASPYSAPFGAGGHGASANPFGYPPAGSPPELIIQAFQRENAYLRDRCHQLETQNNQIRAIVKEMREEMEKIAAAHARRLSPEPFDTENEVQIRNLRQHNALLVEQL